jgi:hypothetical protein
MARADAKPQKSAKPQKATAVAAASRQTAQGNVSEPKGEAQAQPASGGSFDSRWSAFR